MKYSKKWSRPILLLALLSLAALLLSSPALMALWEHYSPLFASTISEEKHPMVTKKLLNLARAMAEFEGWKYGDENGVGIEFASVSFKNHNPGNLRASPFEVGKRNNFSVFIDDEIGFFALVWDLHQKAKGNTFTGLNGESSIYDLIKVYSGESPEIVMNYARFIEEKTGLKMTTKIGDLIK